MKAEINNENKAKFFALYWGQEVAVNPLGVLIINGRVLDYVNEGAMESYLSLKPLSSISDEDAIEVAKIINKDLENGEFIEIEDLCHKCVKYDNGQVLIYTDDLSFISYSRPIGGFIQSQSLTNQWISPLSILQSLDYLRSKGYALPWMGLSVEEMVEAGWIKLIES